MSAASLTSARWYVMLFPSAAELPALRASVRALAARAGGEPAPDPHVTVGYFVGAADPAAAMARVRGLDGPAVPIHAARLFSWSDRPHPLFGYTLSLRVERDTGILGWQQATRAALEPLLAPVFTWEEQAPHMQVVRRLPAPPTETLARLPDDVCLTFTGARLLLSRQRGDEFVTLLDLPLRREA